MSPLSVRTRTGSAPLLPFLLALLFTARFVSAQISLPTAIDLALQNNPKVKLAEADLSRANVALSEARDVFVPAVSASGGVGKATGAPLSPPVVFSVAAQSLVYNFSQPDYIRAAHAGVNSAQMALGVARTDVAEDVTSTYVSLDNALQRRLVLGETFDIANRLVTLVTDRFTAGVDPHTEVTRAHRTAAGIHLQLLLGEDEVAADIDHLAALTGLPPAGWTTDPTSIPPLDPTPALAAFTRADAVTQAPGISAAFEAARAKQLTAHGESRYLLRPQLSLSAQYSKLSDAFSSYDFYYPGFRERITCTPRCFDSGKQNSFNSLSIGVQLTLPLLDMVHRARAHEAAIDAQRAFLDAEVQQIAFLEGRHKLVHSTQELAARAELASLDHDLAQDQLEAVAIRLRASAGAVPGEQMTPKDAENARLAERQRKVDALDADLQLRRAEISLLRQNGSLALWLAGAIPAAANPGPALHASPAATPSPGVYAKPAPNASPAATPSPAPNAKPAPNASPAATPSKATPNPAVPGPTPALPATLGTAPGSAPSSTTPPTTGTTPPVLPSAPVSTPGPATTGPPVPATPAPPPPR